MFEVPEDFRGPLSQSAIELISIDFLDDGEWWVTALTKLKISLVFNGFSDIEAVRRDSERINSVHESVTAAIVAMEKAQDAETLYGKLSAKMIADHFAEHGETLISFGSTSYGGGKILKEMAEYMSQSEGSVRGIKMLATGIAFRFQERGEALTFGQSYDGTPSTKYCRVVKLMIDENKLHSHWRRAAKFGIEFAAENPRTNLIP